MGLPHDSDSDSDSDSESLSDDGSSPVCASPAVKGSPLWPQSFGRAMDLFTRSTSQRSDDNAGLPEAVATTALESGASPYVEAGKEYNENLKPLLGKFDLRQSEDVADGAGESRVQGSSFFQALFNGMNVLAGSKNYLFHFVLFDVTSAGTGSPTSTLL